MLGRTPVIDAGAHKLENPLVFIDYLDPNYRNRLRLVADALGRQRIAVDDRNPSAGATALVRFYPQSDGLGKGAFCAAPPDAALGALFNRVRLAHMDREGVDVQVVYPWLALGFGSVLDRDLAVALCRAYNDYIRADCDPYRGRLFPVGVLPLQDVTEALRELRRCVGELGLTAVAIPPSLPVPHPDAPEAFPRLRAPLHLSDARFFPLYEAAQELDVALAIHGAPAMHLCSGAGDQLDSAALVDLFSERDQQQMALAKLIMDGVLERFAQLRVGFIGAGCGWLPDLVYGLSRQWQRRVRDVDGGIGLPSTRVAWETLRERGAPLGGLLSRAKTALAMVESPGGGEGAGGRREHRGPSRDPEEYIARGQIFTTVASDDRAPIYLRTAFGPVGERQACWASAYGRFSGDADGSVARLRQHPEIGLNYAERLLARNALRFYGRRLEQRIALRMGSKRKGPEAAALTASAAIVTRR